MPKIRQKGSVIVWVAASLIPLMGVLGVSIDAGRAYLAKERLQSALDGAGLAAARADAVSLVNDPALRWSQDVQPVMLNFFKLNFPIGFMGNGVDGYPQTIPQKVSDDGITMKFHASATIPTTFMRIMGVNQMTVIADTVVVRGRHKMEIVFAIDNTGSFGTSFNQQSNVQYNQP
ncbi:MAG: pilus assembly protein TadG-related protein, partial [Dongiaceae bacterium]